MVEIAPSLLAADFWNLEKQIKTLEEQNIKYLHLDVMDGNFVPNISFGFPVIKALREKTNMIFDVHLMIENPLKYIRDFKDAGADIITIHYEADKHIDRTISEIKNLGLKAGIAINPATSINLLENILCEVDLILVMSVNPGFGGQKFINYTLKKIEALKKMCSNFNVKPIIEVDGGVDSTNIKMICNSGAELLVAGSSVFRNNDIKNNIKLLMDEVK